MLDRKRSSMKFNCWEFKQCGREPGGARADELGVCPAATASGVDGVNDGTNGGRACWAVAGTLCPSQVEGTDACQFLNCLQCEFYAQVQQEEGEEAVRTREILIRQGILPSSVSPARPAP